jgi:hypothetical protein
MLVAVGCTTVQYDGPRLPRSEVARVSGDGTDIRMIDDDRVDANYVEILPGEHRMEVGIGPRKNEPMLVSGFRSTHDLTVCFTAYAGRLYHVRPAATVPYVPNHWRPAVFDYKADVYVDHPCPVPGPRPVVLPASSPAKNANESPPPGPPVPQATDQE